MFLVVLKRQHAFFSLFLQSGGGGAGQTRSLFLGGSLKKGRANHVALGRQVLIVTCFEAGLPEECSDLWVHDQTPRAERGPAPSLARALKKNRTAVETRGGGWRASRGGGGGERVFWQANLR